METTEQARSTIWEAITAWSGPEGADGKPAKGPYAFARAANVSASMLYQFARPAKKVASKKVVLGRDTVNAIAPLLPGVSRATWLAAMGVSTPEGIEASL